jgi:hypothetical protein
VINLDIHLPELKKALLKSEAFFVIKEQINKADSVFIKDFEVVNGYR